MEGDRVVCAVGGCGEVVAWGRRPNMVRVILASGLEIEVHEKYLSPAPEIESESPASSAVQPLVLGQGLEPNDEQFPPAPEPPECPHGWIEWYYVKKKSKIYPYKRYCYRVAGEKRSHHLPHRRVDAVKRAIECKYSIPKILKLLGK